MEPVQHNPQLTIYNSKSHLPKTPNNRNSSSPQRQKLQDRQLSSEYQPEDVVTSYKSIFKGHQDSDFQYQRPVTAKKQYKSHPFDLEAQIECKIRFSPDKIEPLELNIKQTRKHDYQTSPFKLESQTQYNTRYSPHKIQPRQVKTKKGRKEDYSPSPFKLEDETQYKKNYSPKKIQPTQVKSKNAKKSDYEPSPFKLQGESQYKQKYSPQKIEAKEIKSKKAKKRQFSFSPFKLQTETQYKYRYSPQKIGISQNQGKKVRKNDNEASPSKLGWQTEYKDRFSPQKMKTQAVAQQSTSKVRPVKSRYQYLDPSPQPLKKAQSSPFKAGQEADTSYKDHYRAHSPDVYSQSRSNNISPRKQFCKLGPYQLKTPTRYREFRQPFESTNRDRIQTSYAPRTAIPYRQHLTHRAYLDR